MARENDGLVQGGNLVVAPHTYEKIPCDSLEYSVAVSLRATNYIAVVIHPDVPFRTAAEMVAWAKQNPGKLTLATNGRT